LTSFQEKYTKRQLFSVDRKKLTYFSYLTIYRRDTVFEINLEFNSQGAVDQIIQEKTKVLFKLKEGAVIELKTENQTIGTHYINGSAPYTKFNMTLPINKQDIELMRTEIISAFRFNFDKELTFDIPKKNAEKVQIMAKCVLE